MQVEVLGGGVIGLSVAVRLLQQGHRVRVLATSLGESTTSAVAAALWYPYLAAPEAATRRWGSRTYEVLTDLATSTPDAGVDLRRGYELSPIASDPPAWHSDVRGFELLPPGLHMRHADGRMAEHGWSFESPVADMATYLPWLAGRAADLGADLVPGVRLAADDLHHRRPEGDLVVLATGLGSRALLGDTSLRPMRGQVVLLEQPGLTTWALDESEHERPTYVVPRRSVVVCGGTALPDRWDDSPEEETTHDILLRCRTMVPMLADAAVVGTRVGLRPVRPQVRLERDDTIGPAGVPVICCYGHGGAGVTLSWGCADDVTALVDQVT